MPSYKITLLYTDEEGEEVLDDVFVEAATEDEARELAKEHADELLDDLDDAFTEEVEVIESRER